MTQSEQYKKDMEDAIARLMKSDPKATLTLLKESDYGNLGGK